MRGCNWLIFIFLVFKQHLNARLVALSLLNNGEVALAKP
jgi:hypothetical protein